MIQCIQCKKCVNVCPVSHTHLNPFLLAWDEKDYEQRLWNCTNCKMCQEVCPQGIDLWYMKMRDRYRTEPPQSMKQSLYLLQSIGFALPISEEINLDREANNLNPISILNPEVLSHLLEK